MKRLNATLKGITSSIFNQQGERFKVNVVKATYKSCMGTTSMPLINPCFSIV